MTEMIERVAKAIRDTNANTVGLTFNDLSEAMARSAIEAMREPGIEIRKLTTFEFAEVEWPKLIDAALAHGDDRALSVKRKSEEKFK